MKINLQSLIVLCLIPFLSLQVLFAQGEKDSCVRMAKFGRAEICLPKLRGYQECYTNPWVKIMADETEAASNEVLAYYLNDSAYENLEEVLLSGFDDYLKIYATKSIAQIEADKEMLSEMQTMFEGNFLQDNWGRVQDEFKKKELLSKVEIGVPFIFDSYNMDANSFTMIFLIKFNIEGVETYTAGTMNMLLVKDRLIWMAYYLRYEGEETYKQVKENSDVILAQIMEANS